MSTRAFGQSFCRFCTVMAILVDFLPLVGLPSSPSSDTRFLALWLSSKSRQPSAWSAPSHWIICFSRVPLADLETRPMYVEKSTPSLKPFLPWSSLPPAGVFVMLITC